MEKTVQILSRRERQIMDVLYKLERGTVAEVLARMPGKPHYSTVRAQLRVLEEKGHVRHEGDGLRYIYIPAVPRDVARRSALRHLIDWSEQNQRAFRTEELPVIFGEATGVDTASILQQWMRAPLQPPQFAPPQVTPPAVH